MEKVTLTCIGCPLGCRICAEREGTEITSIQGNTCPKGEKYARKELTNPTRILTTTLRVAGGVLPVVPVKTARDIPKEKMLACVRALGAMTAAAPIALGEVLVRDVAGTGVDVVATKCVEKA